MVKANHALSNSAQGFSAINDRLLSIECQKDAPLKPFIQ